MLSSVKNVFKGNNKDIILTPADVTYVAGFNVTFKYRTFFQHHLSSVFCQIWNSSKADEIGEEIVFVWDNSNKRCLFLSHDNEFYLRLNNNIKKLKDSFWNIKYLQDCYRSIILHLDSYWEVKYLTEVRN